MTGKVAIQPSGAMDKPTKPLMAMKVTLLVKNRPWQSVSRIKLGFMRDSLSAAAYEKLSPRLTHPLLLLIA
jgi:hypothetical protein